MDRNLVAGCAFVIFVAVGAAVALTNRDLEAQSPTASVAPAKKYSRHVGSPLSATRFTTAREPDPATPAPGDAALLSQVEHKYQYLFADVDRAYVEELKRRLLEREGEASVVRRARIDASIGDLLPAQDFAYYQALKDSDLEQHHLAEYTGGVSSVAALDARQERIVLEAKLRQKERYASIASDVGLDRATLSAAEREFAHARVAEALRYYLDDFLMEVSPSLSVDQYTLLKNYETTEFTRELSRLQQRINAK